MVIEQSQRWLSLKTYFSSLDFSRHVITNITMQLVFLPYVCFSSIRPCATILNFTPTYGPREASPRCTSSRYDGPVSYYIFDYFNPSERLCLFNQLELHQSFHDFHWRIFRVREKTVWKRKFPKVLHYVTSVVGVVNMRLKECGKVKVKKGSKDQNQMH